ncbi:MAG: 4Fe-4S binding protein [Promethearchaeota archaeon]
MLLQDPSQQVDPLTMLLTPILMVTIFIIALILIRKANLSKKKAYSLSIISFIGVGVLLGGRPNPVNAINQLLINLSPTTSMSIPLFLSSLGVLSIMLASVIFFSRIFCGYVCPLGSMQELASKVNFKLSLKEQKKVKFNFDPPEKILRIIRWIYLGVLGVTAILWGLSVSPFLDPFTGFQFLTRSSDLVIISVFFVLGILISGFFLYRPWCRLFCPFGAISGLISFSRARYVRTSECTDCGLCERICPSHAAYRNNTKTECYYCNRCVEICPQDAIKYAKATSTKI